VPITFSRVDKAELAKLLPDVIPVVIGGFITLAGTFLVQVFVIPRVQAYNRQRERWEKDVIDLAGLLEEDLPSALRAYRMADHSLHYAKKWQNDADLDQERVKALLQTMEHEKREAGQVVSDKMGRLAVLERRASRIRANAPYWGILFRRRVMLRIALDPVEYELPGHRELEDDERWEATWDEVEKRRKELFDQVKEIPERVKHPSRQALRRLRRGCERKIRAAGWPGRSANRRRQNASRLQLHDQLRNKREQSRSPTGSEG